jgi:uncharacterized membrane protein YcgQ (UPF0703/DUF1980 family)
MLARSFAVVAGGLFSWSMIDLVVSGNIQYYLADQKFSLLVLVGGVLLGIMVLLKIRALTLGIGHIHHDHGHHHDHAHAHDHAHHHHEHGPQCAHDHAQHHAHGHDHVHEHGVSLWRYMVLSVPLMIILMGLAPQGLSADIYRQRMSKEQLEAIAAVGNATLPAGRNPNGAEVRETIKQLSEAAQDPGRRAFWESTQKPVVVRTIGQYIPESGYTNRYRLMRIKITCCAADATPVGVLVMGTTDHLPKPPAYGDWLEVVGPVSFVEVPNSRTGLAQYFAVIHQQRSIRTQQPPELYLE